MSATSSTTAATTASPAVDTTTTFNAYAVHSADGSFVPWTYHPRVLGEEDVEIAITHCGICGSDIHTAFGGWGVATYPVVVGHEIVGTVVKRGPKALWQIGDRIGVGAQCHSCLNRDEAPCSGCSVKQENYCTRDMIWTYNSRYRDGELSRGGYASHVRVDSNFAFKLPDALPSSAAAPLLCAGATVWAPLVQSKVGPGTRIGIVGIGGLGHLAVQFAAKLGAHVTAIGTSPDKEPLARKLGASAYISLRDDAQVEAAYRSLDLLMVSANAPDMPWPKFFNLCRLNGQVLLVALPDKPIPVPAFSLTGQSISIKGFAIASVGEIRDMLEFCARNDVRAMIEEFDMKDVNTAVKLVEQNKVRFRAVLKN